MRNREHGRRGHSLIELLVVISVVTVILSSTTVVLHGMYRADRAARRDLEASAGVARLAQRFRTDAHAARSAEVRESVLSLTLADSRSIDYEFAGQRIERIVRRDGEIEHRDAFRLGIGAAARWKVQEDGDVTFAGIQLTLLEGKSSQIEARVGTDHRFQKGK